MARERLVTMLIGVIGVIKEIVPRFLYSPKLKARCLRRMMVGSAALAGGFLWVTGWLQTFLVIWGVSLLISAHETYYLLRRGVVRDPYGD